MSLPVIMTRMGRWLVVASCLACGSEADPAGDDHADDPCVPGASIACECDDGSSGTQVCEPDGVGYDACACEGDDGSGGDPSATDPSVGTTPGDPSGDPSDPSGDESGDESGDPSDPSVGTETDTAGAIPQFESDIVPILYEACGAGSVSCHARNAYFPNADQGCRGWLSLEDVPLGSSFDDLDPETQMPSEGPVPGCSDRDLHARLMELAPWECGADARYVVPGSPEQSYIFAKLTDGTICGDFRVMPPPNEGYEITAAQRDALEAWILAGALP